MAAPGWYPDPAGEPDTFRYFDGDTWTASTSRGTPPPTPPLDPGPAPLAPLPAAFGSEQDDDSIGQGWPARDEDEPSRRTTGILFAIVAVLAIAGIVGVLVFGLPSEDEPSANPGNDPSAPPSAPSPSEDQPSDDADPSTPPEDVDPACVAGDPAAGAAPPTGQGITGGDLMLPLVQGFPLVGGGGGFTFADGVSALARQVEESWVAVYALGSVPTAQDGPGLEETAETVLECMTASPDIYSGFSERTDLDSEAVEVDGREAWSLSAEVRVEDPDVQVEGDVARVVVVDTGDPDAYSLFVSVVPIGDRKLIRQQDAVVEELGLAGGRTL